MVPADEVCILTVVHHVHELQVLVVEDGREEALRGGVERRQLVHLGTRRGVLERCPFNLKPYKVRPKGHFNFQLAEQS